MRHETSKRRRRQTLLCDFVTANTCDRPIADRSGSAYWGSAKRAPGSSWVRPRRRWPLQPRSFSPISTTNSSIGWSGRSLNAMACAKLDRRRATMPSADRLMFLPCQRWKRETGIATDGGGDARRSVGRRRRTGRLGLRALAARKRAAAKRGISRYYYFSLTSITLIINTGHRYDSPMYNIYLSFLHSLKMPSKFICILRITFYC